MRFWHRDGQFHTNASLTLVRCWGLAAFRESLPARCPTACQGHSNIEQNLSHQHSTHQLEAASVCALPSTRCDRVLLEFAKHTQTTTLGTGSTGEEFL